MGRIFKYLKARQWLYVFFCLVFVVLGVCLELKMPDYMSKITMLVETPGSEMSEVLKQGGMMLLCAVVSMITIIVTSFFAAKVGAGISKTLRDNVYNKVMDFSMEEIGRFSTASLINRTTNDITQVQMLFVMGLSMVIKAPIMAVWAIIKIADKNLQWTTATVVAVGVLILMLLTLMIFAVPRFKKIQTLTDNLNRVTREQLNGIRVVRAYNAESYQEEKFKVANDALTNNNLVVQRLMAIIGPVMTLISSGLSVAVYWIGVILIENAAVTDKLTIFSDMVVFTNYAMQVIMSFMMFAMVFILFPRAQVSAKRILEVLDCDPRIKDGMGYDKVTEAKDGMGCDKVAATKGSIEFNKVSFRYPDAGSDAISDISFKVGKGETVAIIGATGSGKTTLINLIPRLFDVTGGEVLVDGVNVKDYTLEELRDKIGYISQKAILFSGSVESNIGYGGGNRPQATEDDIKKAAKIAQSDDFISKMPDGYASRIAQGGTNVSGGQKQRISIARAIARKPEILIFDDSFSALDYKTDRALRQALEDNLKDTTRVIVAQRIGTIRNADKIIVLEHGKVVGIGKHDDLLKNCEVYKEIAESQLSKEELANG